MLIKYFKPYLSLKPRLFSHFIIDQLQIKMHGLSLPTIFSPKDNKEKTCLYNCSQVLLI